ncbi:MAG: NAD(P)/FAD-dependent oxidoreductase [Chloroflexi bacterium]|nr:NAD(P)/FAD-dependent oxidoreductase [Chloroflexota bacterium]
MKVAIVGGGIAGLTAAFDLCQRGHEVTVFEKEKDLGGELGVFEVGGQPLEKFYHHIFRGDRVAIELIEQVGLGARLEWLPSKMAFYHEGRIYPFVTPLDLLRFKPLRFIDRLRLGIAGLYLQRLRDWQKLESTTAREWIIKNTSQRTYDVVWGPLLRSKFGERAAEISMAWFWGRIYVRMGSRGKGMSQEVLGYLRGSFGQLIDRLAGGIRNNGGQVVVSSPVRRIIVTNGKVAGVETLAGGFPCDLAIVTTSSDTFADIAPDLPMDYRAKLRSFVYQAAQCLVLVLDRPLISTYWLNVADEAIPFLAVVEHTNLVSAEDYHGKHIIFLPQYLSRASPWLAMTRGELLERFQPYLNRFNPEFSPLWVEKSFLFRDMAAQPVIPVNYSRLILPHRTPVSGLFLANTTQIYPEDRGINYSIRLGHKVASLAVGN